jgi:hypothetical protein
MHEIPAWQIEMLLDGLAAEDMAGAHAPVDDELRADPDPFGDLPPYMRP